MESHSLPAEYPPLAALPQLTLHPSIDLEQLDPAKIANDWLTSFSKSLSLSLKSLSTSRLDKGKIQAHFLEKESWWRDFASFSWDIACRNGSEAISSYLASSTSGFSDPRLDQPGALLQPHLADLGGMRFIQAGFGFKTRFGEGRGVLRLANVGREDQWKAWTVFTVLERLNGQEAETERAKEEKEKEKDKDNSSLQVLIVGAGQAGLALAAHLQNLGLEYLVVDKACRPGDSWRARYSSVKTHTPIYTDHYPFLKYPTCWPRYLHQEHIIRWMEHYGDILGLNVRHGTLANDIEYNQLTRRYSVKLQSNDGDGDGVEQTVVTTKHLVLATGLLSDIPILPSFPGEDTFKGQIYHTSAHKSARLVPDVQNKKITIIGAGTSAHDVAQDFVNHGAKSVTMVQRSPIFVTSLTSLEQLQLKLWDTPGLSTEDADLLGNSLPTAVVRTLSVGASQMMAVLDKELLDGLEAAGLAVKRGEMGDSLVDHQLIKAGHFYIDQGACEMIIDGRIRARRCEKGVRGYYPEGITLADGTLVESDIVVLATGFERTDKGIERIMPREIMDKLGEICSLDESQERIGTWRPTGMPGFWFMTGSFLWSRQFSPILALQIAAIEWGLNKEYQW
ncbi:hypothetical protein BDV06DRAFT_180956 [Aspergillus oleicola]